MEKMTKKIKIFQTYFIIAFGLFVNSIGWTAFLIPSKVIGGGLTGVGTLIYYITGFPVGISYLVMNFFLIVIAIKILGKKFGVKTIFAICLTSLYTTIFQQIFKTPLVNDSFMATIIGAGLGGAGIGIVFTQGGSTGGTDIIAMIINKYKDISPGRVLLMVDALVIGSSFLVFKSIEKTIYGFVAIAVSTYVIDIVLQGTKQSAQIFVISEKYEKIADRITKEMHRGVTIIDGKGWYSHESKNIIMVLVRKNETQNILRVVHEEDQRAFTSISSVTGVYGKGFESIKM